MTVQDNNGGQYSRIGDIKRGSTDRVRWAKEVVWLPGKKSTEIALFQSLEGIGCVGIDLGRIKDGGNPEERLSVVPVLRESPHGIHTYR